MRALLTLALLPLSLLAFRVPCVEAQDPDRDRIRASLPILELVTSTRALALGGAFLPGNGDHAIFHHPALISSQGLDISIRGVFWVEGRNLNTPDGVDRTDDSGATAGHGAGHSYDSRHPHNEATYIAASAGFSWLGGTVAAGMALFDYGVWFDTDVPAPQRAWRGATEFVCLVGYSREVFGFGLGANAKLAGRTLVGVRERGSALDLGVAREIGPVIAALSVQNVRHGPELWVYSESLPTRLVLGAGTGRRMPLGPLDIGGAVQVAREEGGEIVPGGGVEIAYRPIVRRVFIARIGAARVREGDGMPLTFGAGFEGGRIQVNYAYNDHEFMLRAHQFGVSVR